MLLSWFHDSIGQNLMILSYPYQMLLWTGPYDPHDCARYRHRHQWRQLAAEQTYARTSNRCIWHNRIPRQRSSDESSSKSHFLYIWSWKRDSCQLWQPFSLLRKITGSHISRFSDKDRPHQPQTRIPFLFSSAPIYIFYLFVIPVCSPLIWHSTRINRPALHQRMEFGVAEIATDGSGWQSELRATTKVEKGKP